jgi:ParB family chromosome partitioning protein
MLGKGLESLIPPNKNAGDTGAGQPFGDDTVPSDLPSGGGAAPSNAPVSGDPTVLPAAEPMAELPAPPTTGQAEPSAAALPSGDAREPAPWPGAPAAGSRAAEKPRAPKQYDAVFHIEVEKIKPNPQQPRRNFDEAGLKELAASIREFGLLQPIVVTKIEREVPTGTEVEYQLVVGERRWLAAKLLGLERIPAIVRNVDLERERLELAVIENIQREDLNPIETARAFARLQDEFRLTQREIAARIGKSRETVANSVRLLSLPREIQEALEQGKVSESHGRLLLTIDDPALQLSLFHDLLANRLTTRDLKNRVEAARPKREQPPAPELSPELKMLQERLASQLGAPVTIHQGVGGGKVTITFYSEEELRNIADRLAGG